MTPTISGSRLTFMCGSQNLDDTVNFLSIPSTMRLCICPACHMLQMLCKACVHAGHNVHGMSKISRRTAARRLAGISGMLRQRGVCRSVLLHRNNLTLHTPKEETRHIKDKNDHVMHITPHRSRLELSLLLLLIHFHVCPVAPISWQTLPTDGPDGWFGRSVIGAWPLINT